MHCHQFIKVCLLSLVLGAGVVDAVRADVCPATPDGTVLTHPNLDPPPGAGEPVPTPAGLLAFVQQKRINRIADLLAAMPAYYRKYYGFIRTTRGTGHASLDKPRIVFYGPDASLLMNVSTDPTDPEHDRLDVASLNRATGDWEFSQLDFTGATPSLHQRPRECTVCHGTPSRPIWGSYLDWPGTIGDDPRPGLQAETLIAEEADRLNALRSGAGSDRFRAVRWAQFPYRAGQAQMLPDNTYGFALTISNNQIGQAQAGSIFQRLKTRFPTRYQDLREALLLLGPLPREGRGPSASDLRNIATRMARYGQQGTRLEDVFSALGVNLRHEVSLDSLASSNAVRLDWNAGSGNVLEFVYALVLHDIARSDANLRTLLSGVKKGTGVYGIWECPNLGENVWDILRYRVMQGWTLRGSARAAEHAVFYALDNTRVQQPIFERTATPLYGYLSARLASVSTPDPTAKLIISGTVRVNGSVAANATLSGAPCTASGTDGRYRCEVSRGFSGVITPQLVRDGVPTLFTPRSRSYSQLTVNRTAQDFSGTR